MNNKPWYQFNVVKRVMNKKAYFIIVYTVLFSIVFLFGYQYFFKNHSSFIWNVDGMKQHYPALVYLGRYWRAVIRSVTSGSLSFPLYDFRLGLGDDIMAPLLTHSANMDLFSLLSTFVPSNKTEVLYNAIVVLRIYASGLTFAFFGRNVVKAKPWAILIGALVYAFSGWAIFTAVRHPHFMIAMVYTPLMVTGLEFILKNKKPYLFIISVFLSALTGYYFLYMESLFLLIYALIRVSSLYEGRYFKRAFVYAVKTTGYYLVGLLMASIIFLPLVAAQLGSSRENHINTTNLFYYNLKDYLYMFTTSISGTSSWESFGMAAIVLIAAVLLFVQNTRHKKYFMIGLLTLLTIRLIPFGNLVFNGFGYVSCRWTFLFAFLLAFLLTYMLPHMVSLDKKGMVACIALVTGYGFITIYHYYKGVTYPVVGFVFLGLTALCLFIPYKRLKITSLFLVLTVNLIMNARFTFQDMVKNQPNYFMKRGRVTEIYHTGHNISDYIQTSNGFYRERRFDMPPNAPIIQDYHGDTEYWSMMNPAYSVGMLELENRQQRPLFWNINGLDSRTVLNALSSVKYILTTGNKGNEIPYGYVEIYKKGKKRSVYSNPYALPIGYTYSKILSPEEYAKLNAAYKQEALLQAVVLSKGDEFVNTNVDSLPFQTTPIPYTRLNYKEADWKNGVLNVGKNKGSITVEFEGLANSETYIRLKGFESDELIETKLNVKGNNQKKGDRARFWRHNFYFNKQNYLFNMGYSEKPQKKVTITFAKEGTYRLDDIEVYCYPMQDYAKQVEDLREDVLENVVFHTNKVTGDVNLNTDKALCFSIPYSKGWSAKVDGEKRELLQANTIFMALPLTEGYHTIELDYFTPGLKAGIAFSILGIVIFIVICVYFRKIK